LAYNTNVQNNTSYLSKAQSFFKNPFKKLFLGTLGAATIAPPALGNIDAVVKNSLTPKYNISSEYQGDTLPPTSDYVASSKITDSSQVEKSQVETKTEEKKNTSNTPNSNTQTNNSTSSNTDTIYVTNNEAIAEAFKKVNYFHTNGTPCPDGNELELKVMKDTIDGEFYFTLAGMDLDGHYKNTNIVDKYLEGKKIDYSNLVVVVSDKSGNNKVYNILEDGISSESIDLDYIVNTKGGLRINKSNVRQVVAGYAEKVEDNDYSHSLASISDVIRVIPGCNDNGKPEGQEPRKRHGKGQKPGKGQEPDDKGKTINIYNIHIYGGEFKPDTPPPKGSGDTSDEGPFFKFDTPSEKPGIEAEAGARNYHFDFNNFITRDLEGNLLHTETKGTGPYAKIKFNHRVSPFNLSLGVSGYQSNGMPITNYSNGKKPGSMTSSHYDFSPEIEAEGHFRGGEKLKLGVKGNIGKTDWNQDYEGIGVHQVFNETKYSGRIGLEDSNFDYDLEAGQDFVNLEQVVNESSTSPFKNNTKSKTTHVEGSLAFKPNTKIKVGPKVRYEKIDNLPYLTGTQPIDANVLQLGGAVSFNPGDYQLSGEFMTSSDAKSVSKTTLGIGAKYKRFGMNLNYDDVKAKLPTEVLREKLIRLGLQVDF